MNTRPVLDPVRQPFALAVAFNADNSFFSVAHESGFKGKPLRRPLRLHGILTTLQSSSRRNVKQGSAEVSEPSKPLQANFLTVDRPERRHRLC